MRSGVQSPVSLQRKTRAQSARAFLFQDGAENLFSSDRKKQKRSLQRKALPGFPLLSFPLGDHGACTVIPRLATTESPPQRNRRRQFPRFTSWRSLCFDSYRLSYRKNLSTTAVYSPQIG